jgi:hypothetical protein
MENKYTLESLIDVFSDHSIRYEEDRIKWIENFKKDYPSEPVPTYLEEYFNLSSALKCICEEILMLKPLFQGKE